MSAPPSRVSARAAGRLSGQLGTVPAVPTPHNPTALTGDRHVQQDARLRPIFDGGSCCACEPNLDLGVSIDRACTHTLTRSLTVRI